MLKRIFAAAAVLTLIVSATVGAQTLAAKPKPIAAQAELSIKEFSFPPTNDKAVRVNVINSGNAVAASSILRLTVRKINGVAVGRTTEIKVPAIPAGKNRWVVINAKSILPNNLALESTTFKLNADAGETVAESDEGNNETWHNQ
jgi:subtilase family serine protease